MVRNLYQLILSALYLILIPEIISPQTKIHNHISTEDGLVSNRIMCMFEDSKGYLWVGTNNGVSRWNGTKFKNYYTNNGLAGSQVFDIEEGPDGTIYFATYGKGVTYLKNDSLTILNEENGLLSNWTTRILVRLNGDIIFAAENGTFTALRNNKLINWKDEIGFGNNSVWSLYESEDSTIYFGSYKLFKYKDNTLTEYTHDHSFNKIRSYQIIYSIEEDLNGNIFVGTLNGIYELKKNQLQKLKISGKSNTNSAISILTGRNGSVYFCGEEGVIIKKEESYEFLDIENGLSENNIWSVCEDSEGLIYFGTRDQGINIYHPNKLETVFTEILYDKNITAIKKDFNNNIYVGTNNGLYKINLKINSITKNLTNMPINVIETNNSDNIYIGSDDGLRVVNRSKISKYTPYAENSALNKVWTISNNNSDEMLIGYQGGLHLLNQSKLSKLSNERAHNQFIQDIIISHDSSLVIGTHGNGLTIYKGGTQKTFSSQNGLADNIINCLHETSDRLLLIGTDQGGLNIIQNNIVLKTIDIDNGLTSNNIMDINEDPLGNIYLSTSKGVNVLYNIMDSLFIRTITSKDGLVSNSCNRNATLLDEEILWIGTNKGITKYNYESDKPNTNPPKIYLTGLEIFNEKYPLNELEKSHELNHDQNYLKFIYTGISLSGPEKIIYRYRLSGVDHDWVSSTENNVQYTSLDDGDYNFEVIARNEWGYWSEPVSLEFYINPAWWETWWFRIIIISAFSGLLWLVFQYRLNYLLKLERLRTKIASDLHDEVGSLLTQISINADSLSYTKDEEKRKEKSSFIRSKSKEVINMMSDVIWSIDARNDNLESLVDRIHNFVLTFLEQKDIALNFNSRISNLQKMLKIDFRQNIMMIVKEAINNAVKYSGCSKIDILIKYDNDKFELFISDNGNGIDFNNITQGNGLKNMKMRAEMIKAEIDYKTENGFTVHVIKNKL